MVDIYLDIWNMLHDVVPFVANMAARKSAQFGFLTEWKNILQKSVDVFFVVFTVVRMWALGWVHSAHTYQYTCHLAAQTMQSWVLLAVNKDGDNTSSW